MKYSLPRDVLRAGRDAFARPNYPFRWILAYCLSRLFRALLADFSDSGQFTAAFDFTDGFLMGSSACEYFCSAVNFGFLLLERLWKTPVKVKITETVMAFDAQKVKAIYIRRETTEYK